MRYRRSWFRKLRFFAGLGSLYLLSSLLIGFALGPLSPLAASRSVALTRTEQQPRLPVTQGVPLIAGLPVRLVIPDSAIDLPIDKGYYNSATGSWTLSGYHAQFMMISSLANNLSGLTYIYGHNNDFVFGSLRHATPKPNSLALIYTANGHILAYRFVGAGSFAPSDTAVLNYQGAPVLDIQTCTGSFNELRTLYRYRFAGVVQ